MRDFCRSAVLFGCGFFMALSICLGAYVVWEEVRPTEPMEFNIMIVPQGSQVNPNTFSSVN